IRKYRAEASAIAGAFRVQCIANESSRNHGHEGLDASLGIQPGMLDLVQFAHMFHGCIALFGESFDRLLLFCWITCAISQDGHDPSNMTAVGLENGSYVNRSPISGSLRDGGCSIVVQGVRQDCQRCQPLALLSWLLRDKLSYSRNARFAQVKQYVWKMDSSSRV